MFLQSLVLVLVIEYTQPDPAKYTDRWATEITKVSAKHFKADSFSRPGDARALNGNKEKLERRQGDMKVLNAAGGRIHLKNTR